MTLKSDAKFERKPNCCFENDKNLVNFDPSSEESRKPALWFCAKYMFVLKVTEELSSMILKSHAKFDEKLTCGLENDMNLAHFHQNIWTCQNCYFHRILLSEVENTRANNLQRLCVMTLKNDKKSEEELTCCSKTDMRNLTNFNSNTQKSEKLALWWAACGQKYKVLQLRK